MSEDGEEKRGGNNNSNILSWQRLFGEWGSLNLAFVLLTILNDTFTTGTVDLSTAGEKFLLFISHSSLFASTECQTFLSIHLHKF